MRLFVCVGTRRRRCVCVRVGEGARNRGKQRAKRLRELGRQVSQTALRARAAAGARGAGHAYMRRPESKRIQLTTNPAGGRPMPIDCFKARRLLSSNAAPPLA